MTQQCHSAGAVGRQLIVTPGVVPCAVPTTTPACPPWAADGLQPLYLPPHSGPGTPSPLLTSSRSQLSSLRTVLPPSSPRCWFGLTSTRLGNHRLRNHCSSRKCQHPRQGLGAPHPHGPTLRLWVQGWHSTELSPSMRLQGSPNEGVSAQICWHAGTAQKPYMLPCPTASSSLLSPHLCAPQALLKQGPLCLSS